MKTKKAVLLFCIAITQSLFCQDAFNFNGEKLSVSKFSISNKDIRYSEDDNKSISPYFGEKLDQNIEGNSICEMAYKILGEICPEASTGKYVIDYSSHFNILPLLNNTMDDPLWDELITAEFSKYLTKVTPEFAKAWKSTGTVQEKKDLLYNNPAMREVLFNEFIVKQHSEYKGQTDRERNFEFKLIADAQAELTNYIKTNKLDEKQGNDAKAKFEAKFKSRKASKNIVAVKYYSVRFHGNFIQLILKYMKAICKKIEKNQTLTKVEQDFHDEYISKKNVALITEAKFLNYTIDKQAISEIIRSIELELKATIKESFGDASFESKLSIETKIDITETFNSEGGYLLQVAENGQFKNISCDSFKINSTK